jgi:hypothetical protein
MRIGAVPHLNPLNKWQRLYMFLFAPVVNVRVGVTSDWYADSHSYF